MLYLLGILLTMIISSILYWKTGCCCHEKCCENPNGKVAVATNGQQLPFEIKGSNFDYFAYNNFKFKQNDNKIVEPVSDSINQGIDKLKAYFDITQ